MALPPGMVVAGAIGFVRMRDNRRAAASHWES
jgi:hypothetical protein